MIPMILFKVLADLGFYYTFSGFVGLLFRIPAKFVMLSLVVQAISFTFSFPLRERGVLRFLPLLLGVAPLLLAASKWEIIVMMPAFLYICSGVKWNHFSLIWDREAAHFSVYWKLLALMLLTMLLLGAYVAAATLIIPLGLVTMTCQIMLMRGLRHDAEVYCQPRYQRLNLLVLGGILLGTGFLSSRLFLTSAGAVLGLLWQVFLRPVALVVGWIVEAILYLVFLLFSLLNLDMTGTLPQTLQKMQEAAEENPMQEQWVPPSYAGYNRALLIIVVAALAAFLVYKLFRYLSDETGVTLKTDRQTTERISLHQEAPTAPRLWGRSPVMRVRAQYRKFLRLNRSAGVVLRPSDTSAEVGEKGKDLFPQDAAQRLRTLYLSARYDDTADKAAADEAEALVKAMRNSK